MIKVILFCLVSAPVFAPASPSDCIKAYGPSPQVEALKDWNELPAVTETELPDEIAKAIETHPRTQAIRTRFGAGEGMAFQLEGRASTGGWLIQGRFLMKLIHQLLPRAKEFASYKDPTPRHFVRLADETLMGQLDPPLFDISDLKVLNYGPKLPDQTSLRAQLSLPTHARIASVYHSYTYDGNLADVVNAILDRKLADLVLLSSQLRESDEAEGISSHATPLIKHQYWITMKPVDRPTRAIIYNETRNRLPYMHAAADFAVVLGHANIFEPIHANRPTYFSVNTGLYKGHLKWQKLAETAVRTGAGHAYTNDRDLLDQLAKMKPLTLPPKITPEDEAQALDNVLKTLELLFNEEAE